MVLVFIQKGESKNTSHFVENDQLCWT